MAVLVEFGVPPEQLAFTEVFEAYPETTLEFELAVSGEAPLSGRLLWIRSADHDEVVSLLETLAIVEAVTVIHSHNGTCLCEIVVDITELKATAVLVENSGYLMRARGTAEGWRFEVLFPHRRDISPFIAESKALGIDPEIRRVDTTPFSREQVRPSENQADALRVALEEGFWEVPRATSLQTIADELDISDQAVSERLRRGIKALVADELGEE